MDGRLALVRATHLNDYIAVLRDIGAPVDRELARSLLPPRIEETPDLYVSVPVALEWIARTGHDLQPDGAGSARRTKSLSRVAASRPTGGHHDGADWPEASRGRWPTCPGTRTVPFK